MTISGFLPRRWRPSAEAACHAEAIAGILNTRPLAPGQGGPTIASLVGAGDVLPYLVAIKSLRHRLARGSIVIIDDGTLTGEDRAILAYHCGDPEIHRHQAVRGIPAPGDSGWALLLTILDGRAGQYWIALDPRTVTLGALPEIAAAIDSNRSFAQLGEEARGGRMRRSERRIAALCGTRGWRYRPGCVGLLGFAAGGTGRALAVGFHAEALSIGQTATSALARNLLFANEREPLVLPNDRYPSLIGAMPSDTAALIHFPRGADEGDAFTSASGRAIAQLPI